MKTLFKGCLLSVVILITGLTNIAFGQSHGTIRFSGMVVEEPCNIYRNDGSLTGQCIRNTKVKSVSISTKNIHYNREVNLPYSLGKMSIQPVINSPRAAVVTVTYL